MDKFARIFEFAQQFFTDEHTAQQTSKIIEGIMKARSAHLSDIAANYTRIQGFLQGNDPREALKTLFNEEADFASGDPTEI